MSQSITELVCHLLKLYNQFILKPECNRFQSAKLLIASDQNPNCHCVKCLSLYSTRPDHRQNIVKSISLCMLIRYRSAFYSLAGFCNDLCSSTNHRSSIQLHQCILYVALIHLIVLYSINWVFICSSQSLDFDLESPCFFINSISVCITWYMKRKIFKYTAFMLTTE